MMMAAASRSRQNQRTCPPHHSQAPQSSTTMAAASAPERRRNPNDVVFFFFFHWHRCRTRRLSFPPRGSIQFAPQDFDYSSVFVLSKYPQSVPAYRRTSKSLCRLLSRGCCCSTCCLAPIAALVVEAVATPSPLQTTVATALDDRLFIAILFSSPLRQRREISTRSASRSSSDSRPSSRQTPSAGRFPCVPCTPPEFPSTYPAASIDEMCTPETAFITEQFVHMKILQLHATTIPLKVTIHPLLRCPFSHAFVVVVGRGSRSDDVELFLLWSWAAKRIDTN